MKMKRRILVIQEGDKELARLVWDRCPFNFVTIDGYHIVINDGRDYLANIPRLIPRPERRQFTPLPRILWIDLGQAWARFLAWWRA